MTKDNSAEEKNMHYVNDLKLSGMHHSADIALIAKLGFEQAFLVHHFQHWIRINRMDPKKKSTHIHEGRCWMYQTREEIHEHFPYMSFETIKYAIEQLILKGVLLARNFNKKRFDKTLWYAFVDEKAVGVDENSVQTYYAQRDEVKKMFTKGKIPHRSGKIPHGEGKIPSPIPDTIPYSETTDNLCNIGSQPVDNFLREQEKSCEQQTDAIASDLSTYLFEEIQKRMPRFKKPNMKEWAIVMDRMIRIDKRESFEIMEVIAWLKNDDWYAANIISPTSLRKKFDEIKSKMMLKDKKTLMSQNRLYAVQMKSQFSQEMKGLTFNEKCAWNCYNTDSGKEASFDLPHETFKNILLNLFGGKPL